MGPPSTLGKTMPQVLPVTSKVAETPAPAHLGIPTATEHSLTLLPAGSGLRSWHVPRVCSVSHSGVDITHRLDWTLCVDTHPIFCTQGGQGVAGRVEVHTANSGFCGTSLAEARITLGHGQAQLQVIQPGLIGSPRRPQASGACPPSLQVTFQCVF